VHINERQRTRVTSNQPANMSGNHLCVIEGDYKIYKKDMMPPPATATSTSTVTATTATPLSTRHKIDELIEYYKLNLSNSGQNEKFKVVHSKDGSELYTQLLASFGLSSMSTTINSEIDMDKTITTLGEYLNNRTLTQFQRTSHINLNNNNNNNANNNTCSSVSNENANYICFVISDFDTNERVFARLEEAQFKLTNFNNMNPNATALSTTTTSCSSFNNFTLMNGTSSNSSSSPSQQCRFMIFGWPIVYFCIKNEMVCCSVFSVLVFRFYNENSSYLFLSKQNKKQQQHFRVC
jgi:hypothetical protein